MTYNEKVLRFKSDGFKSFTCPHQQFGLKLPKENYKINNQFKLVILKCKTNLYTIQFIFITKNEAISSLKELHDYCGSKIKNLGNNVT